MYDVFNMPDLVVRYFSSTPWLVVFILSTIYLFFRIDSAHKRAMIAAGVTFFLVINTYVIKVFTGLNQNSTFYRNLWAIPSIVIVSIAVIDLIRVLPKWFLKVPAIVAIIIFLWFLNNHEYIRCRAQPFSADAKLVSKDVIELGDKLEEFRNQSEKNTLFVICPTTYESNYGNMCVELSLYGGFITVKNASIIDDENHNGEIELTRDIPDPSYIMEACCSKGLDYIIVSKHERTDEIFTSYGYYSLLQTDGYILYRCEGFKGYTLDLDAWGLTKRISWHDEKGKTVLNGDGYGAIEYKRDKEGRVIEELYYNEDNNLTTIPSGYARTTMKYDNAGNLIEKRLYNEYGALSGHYGSEWSILRNDWDDRGNLIRTRYYDVNDEPMTDYAIAFGIAHSYEEFAYDDQNNKVSEQLFDIHGEPAVTEVGYDEIRYAYDKKNKLIRQGYYANGKLINRKDTSYAEIVFEYNEEDEIQSQVFFDKDGNMVKR